MKKLPVANTVTPITPITEIIIIKDDDRKQIPKKMNTKFFFELND